MNRKLKTLKTSIEKLFPLGADMSDPYDAKYLVDAHPLVLENEKGVLMVSSDNGTYFIDYYGEYRGGYAWIDPRLEAAAKAAGFFWEWRDAGTIAAYPA